MCNKKNRITYKKAVRNKGSAVIEVTLLIPIILYCVYFYIMSMLYITEHAKAVDCLSENLYSGISYSDDTQKEKALPNSHLSDDDNYAGQIGYVKNGEASYDGDFENYKISIKLDADGSDPIKSLRRWQLVADTIGKRGNE